MTTLITTQCSIVPADKFEARRHSDGDVTIQLSDSFRNIEGAAVVLIEKDALALARGILAAHHAANPPQPCTPAPAPAPKPVAQPRLSNLSAQSKMIFQHISRAGSISAREAMNDYGITSSTLSRRICDIEEEGFSVTRTKRRHPMTDRQFTRYTLG